MTRSQINVSSPRQWLQVAIATGLIAGVPVAFVWWLRASGAVSSAVLGLVLGVALSLSASAVGCVAWEKWSGASDLLFSELMIWGFLHRLRSQRRLACALDMLGPLSDPQRLELHGLSVKEQVKLLESLVAGTETHDPYLHDHSRRVARHAWMIARRMGLPRAEVARIRTAASLHDVGKLETPIEILHKPGPLTDHEFAVIKRHPADGASMADSLRDPALTAMIRHHHERLDGSGYPDGLRGEEIPLGARIIAVTDTFDAITSKRPYRPARPHKHAINILREEAGTKLDADVVRAFCAHYAGRAPIAMWSSIAGLPERILSWLGSSVGSVASVAKVAALTALIGGAAVTTSTLGPPRAKRHEPDTRTASKGATQTPGAHPSPGTARAHTVALTASASRHAGRARPDLRRSTRDGAAPAGESTVASSATAPSQSAVASTPGAADETPATAPVNERGLSGQGSGSHPAEGSGARGHEGPAGNGRHAEAPHSGASQERAGQGRSEEAHAKPEASATGSAASEEAPGKSSESSVKGNSEVAQSKSEESSSNAKGATNSSRESAQQSSPAPR
jgi:putative nucleotidyltransferase with HDIG domain